MKTNLDFEEKLKYNGFPVIPLFDIIPFLNTIRKDKRLVYKSSCNNTSNIRFSIQLRFSDLACNDYKNRNYPLNHKILIKDF